MQNQELVAVMVPKKHLAQVYGFIARLEQGEVSPAKNENELEQTGDVTMDEWTPSRIRKMVQESPPAMRDILRALADNTEHWMTTQQLADAIQNNPNADWKTVAGTLGAFGRRIKSRYGLETLPFERRYDHEVEGKVHRMSSEMAKRIMPALENGN